jgi:hypothetical protein
MLSVAAALLAGGCGNYSSEDIRFLSALPHREDLHVAVPAGGAAPAGGLVSSAALSGCADPGQATAWVDAKKTSDGLNAAVDWLIRLVDAVRKYPPAERREDSRRWGPFDDEKHPAFEIQVVIDRSWPLGEDGPPSHQYRFEARRKGTTAFTTILGGHFDGASSSRGAGSLSLEFTRLIALGMQDADTPNATLTVDYDRASEPTTIDLRLTSAGFGVAGFDYQYDGYADGSGIFTYQIVNATAELTVTASWNPAKAGRARISYQPLPVVGPPGEIDNCWSGDACLVYAYDPYDVSCETPPCTMAPAAKAACPGDTPVDPLQPPIP